jgi:hypothetical protein
VKKKRKKIKVNEESVKEFEKLKDFEEKKK